MASVPEELQQLDNWCWAAVSVAVAKSYDDGSPATQAGVATTVCGRQCDPPTHGGPCDLPQPLDRGLRAVGHYLDEFDSPATFASVTAEVGQNPLCAMQSWTLLPGQNHFVVIFGAFSNGGVEYVEIMDPSSGISTLTYDVFRTNYSSLEGMWTRTYRTTSSMPPLGGGVHEVPGSA